MILPMSNNSRFPMVGDNRLLESPQLLALHTIFLREHNRKATELQNLNSTWSDELLFQEARRSTIALLQAIHFYEFIPTMNGRNIVGTSFTYNSNANPQVSVEFSMAVYRFMHTQVSTVVSRLDGLLRPTRAVLMRDAFYNPAFYNDTPIETVLRGMHRQVCQENDVKVVDDLRNYLYTPQFSLSSTPVWMTDNPEKDSLHVNALPVDVVAIDIERGREVGLPTLNRARLALGLTPYTDFSDIDPTNRPLTSALAAIYDSVDDVDLIVGGWSEPHIPGSVVGPTFSGIMVEQFTRTRAGDRLWFENPAINYYTSDERRDVRNTKLVHVIRRNSVIDLEVSDNLWLTSDGSKLTSLVNPPLDSYVDPLADLRAKYMASLKIHNLLFFFWTIDPLTRTFYAALHGSGQGWLAMGFSPVSRGMPSADIHIGGYIDLSGNLFLADMWATSQDRPRQDVELGGSTIIDGNVTVSDGFMRMEFSRPLNSTDRYDQNISMGVNNMIFAFNPETDGFTFHGPNRLRYVADLSVGVLPTCDRFTEDVADKLPTNWKRIILARCRTYVVQSSSIYILYAAYALSSVGVLICACLAAVTLYYRAKPVMRASSPVLLIVMLAGCMLIFLSVIFFDADRVHIPGLAESDYTLICHSGIWLLTLGFVISLGSLIGRAWRVGQIFNNKSMSVVSVSDWGLMARVGVAVAIVVLINTIFQLESPLQSQLQTLTSTASRTTSRYVCTSSHAQLYSLALIGYLAVVLLYGCWTAYEVRKVPSDFNESSQVSSSLANIGLVSALIFSVAALLDTDNAESTRLILTIGIYWANLSTIGIIFFPKLSIVCVEPDTVAVTRYQGSYLAPSHLGRDSHISNHGADKPNPAHTTHTPTHHNQPLYKPSHSKVHHHPPAHALNKDPFHLAHRIQPQPQPPSSQPHTDHHQHGGGGGEHAQDQSVFDHPHQVEDGHPADAQSHPEVSVTKPLIDSSIRPTELGSPHGLSRALSLSAASQSVVSRGLRGPNQTVSPPTSPHQQATAAQS